MTTTTHFTTRSFASAGPPTGVFTEATAMREPKVPALTLTLTRQAARTATQLVAAQPQLDSKHRVGLGKLVGALRWTAGDTVLAVVDGDRVVLTRDSGEVQRPALCLRLKVDQQRRLTLPAAVCFALGVTPGHQVQAIADPDTGELTLLALATALATLLERNVA